MQDDRSLFYQTKNVEIFKCGNYTFSFMSKRRFVNLTGCKTYQDIIKAITLFKIYTNVFRIYNLKIDTMLAVYHPICEILEPPSDRFYKLIKPKFPGIIYRHKTSKRGCTVFPSSIVFWGFKSTKELMSTFNHVF